MFGCFAVGHTNKPFVDESLITTILQDTGIALSVFLMPLAEGTENLRATCWLNYAARARPICCGLSLLFFAFNFKFPFLRSRAYDVLIPLQDKCRIQYTPDATRPQNSGLQEWDDYNILFANCKCLLHVWMIIAKVWQSAHLCLSATL